MHLRNKILLLGLNSVSKVLELPSQPREIRHKFVSHWRTIVLQTGLNKRKKNNVIKKEINIKKIKNTN